MQIQRALRGDGLENDALFYAATLRAAKTPQERDRILEQIWISAEQLEEALGGDPSARGEGGDRENDPAALKAGEWYNKATGQIVAFAAHLDAYLAAIEKTNTPKVANTKRATITKFALEFATVGDVTRKTVRLWIGRQLTTPANVRRLLAELKDYWIFLVSLDAAPEANPFDKPSLPSHSKKSVDGLRRPFSAPDVLNLLGEARRRVDMPLVALIELARWTGCRIEELCSLKIERVNSAAGYIEIVDAKTAAGRRQIPLHSKLKPILAALIDNRAGYVLDRLPANKYGARSGAIGKRFSKMKTALGYDGRWVFHSLRKTVSTLLENAEVPEGVAADILGHEKASLTYGLYSGGTSLARKSAAIEKLDYGD